MNKTTTNLSKQERSKAQKEAWYTLNPQSFEEWLDGKRNFRDPKEQQDLRMYI